jgi:hypothetical protein
VALDEKEKYNRVHVFQLTSTMWLKKNKDMGERRFFFATTNEE